MNKSWGALRGFWGGCFFFSPQALSCTFPATREKANPQRAPRENQLILAWAQ